MRSLLLGLCLLLSGCQGATRYPQAVTVIQPGQAQTFVIKIYNYTQNDLLLTLPGAIQGELIHGNGGWYGFDLGFLPYSFSTYVQTTTLPTYYYPPQTYTLGQQYNSSASEVDVFYY